MDDGREEVAQNHIERKNTSTVVRRKIVRTDTLIFNTLQLFNTQQLLFNILNALLSFFFALVFQYLLYIVLQFS
ncbi:hypothetical protein FGO68_gene12677 [Halteria grandinella]|uniref:Transmembrane protein n=1 Tax=Halteria grandinella TaxID=5974 RepID=A0A8J8P5L0_HALGN|nr:hypothetical protein FGO68_gene12677 [Halteria grandinella]